MYLSAGHANAFSVNGCSAERFLTYTFMKAKPKVSSVMSITAKPKKKKTAKKKKTTTTEPKPLEIPKRERVIRKEETDDWVPTAIDNDTVEIFAMNVAKADTWRERKQHLVPLLKFYLTFEQLSRIIHRFPSFQERIKAMEMLRNSVHDSEHSFYLFSQGFALVEERKTVSNIFRIPLVE